MAESKPVWLRPIGLQRFLFCAAVCAWLAAAQSQQPAKPPAGDPAKDLTPYLRQFVEVFSTVQAESPEARSTKAWALLKTPHLKRQYSKRLPI